MKRTVVLLDVTAMSGDAACVAGLDLKSGETVRLNDPQPTRRDVARLSIVPGKVVEVEWEPEKRPTRPHVEDGRWNLRSLKILRTMPLAELQELLNATAFDSVNEAFGTSTSRAHNRNRAWPSGEGERSLATIRVRYVRGTDDGGRIRMDCRDQAGDYWSAIPFQDLRVKRHWSECDNCRAAHLENIERDFDANRALIRVGLTRPFAPNPDQPAVCWLQVTNVFARDRTHF